MLIMISQSFHFSWGHLTCSSWKSVIEYQTNQPFL